MYNTIIINQEVFDSRPLLDPDFKKELLVALRSGEYKHGTRVLHNLDTNEYCCLGVICSLQKLPFTSIKDQLISGNFARYGVSSKFLSNGNPLLGVLGHNGYFHGFFIDTRDKKYYNLASVNDDCNNFVLVSQIIEKYF